MNVVNWIAGSSITGVWARWLLAIVFSFLPAVCVSGASITWGSPASISGDADVNNAGTLVYAYTGGNTGATVNGVAFAAGNSGTAWDANVGLTGFGSTYNAYNATTAPWTNLSSAYKAVLQGGAYGGATTGTVMLNGLTYGHAYTVQIWVNDPRAYGAGRTETATSAGGNTVTLDYNNLNAVGGVGQYSIGTFVANGVSQTFTLTSGSSDQLNALQLRDNGYAGAQSVPTPSRFNLAKFQPVITDSTNGTQSAAYITQGFVDDDSCWVSGGVGPHWAEVVFPFPVTVGSAQLAMGQKNASPMTTFYFQYLTNGTWVTVPGSSVVNNVNVERNVVFSSPVTATAFRVYDAQDNPIRIRQLALYPPNGPGGYPFGTDFSINLARKQPAYATTNTFGGWPLLAADGLVDPSSAWQTTLVGSNSLLINLQFTNKIGSVHLYSGMNSVPPLSDFVLQYWTGSAWANISGGSVTGNTNGALVIPFTTPVSTTKVQLVFTNTGTSAVQELCVFPANSNGGYPLGTGIISNTPVSAKYDTYSDSYYYLSNSATASVIVESNAVPISGMPAVTNWLSQYQVLLNYDTGTYRLINRQTGLCLSGYQLSTNPGTALVDEDYSGLPDQDWYLQTTDGINFYIVNQYSGLALDAQGGGLVQNLQSPNSPTQLWQIGLAQIFPKKGIAGVGSYAGTDRRVTFDANWSYSWWYTANVAWPTNYNYYPMDMTGWDYRNGTVAGNLWGLEPGWRSTGYSLNVLGYNEPDQTAQANIDATNGAIRWLNDQNLDLPLVGPAAANVNGPWNQIFFGYITNWGCRVDYLPAHEYVSPAGGSSSAWINPLQTAYNTYGIPMWMTEFGVVDWAGNQSWTEEDNYNALAEFLWRAEGISWLRKYSLFIFQANTNFPMAPNPWTATTPAPSSNSYDTNGNLTPFGELYAAWDDDANVETNKVYYLHNSGTRKRLRNTLGATADATDIRIEDFSTKWTLQSAGSPNLFYITSALDGRRLSYSSGGSVNLVAAGTVGADMQWSLTPYQYGWYYLDHPETGLRLQLAFNNGTGVATFTMVTNTTTTTAVKWRCIVPLSPLTWTGYSNNSWTNAANWSSQQTPAGLSVIFNSLSLSNLNTVLDADFSLSSVTVTTPAGPVSISGTNRLTLSGGIDLSTASQNLTLSAPLVLGGNQSWNVSGGRTLTGDGGVSGSAALTLTGSGAVVLGGAAGYTGATVIDTNCTLRLSASNVLPNGINSASSAGDITNNGTLDLNGTAQAINGLSGSGIVDNTAIGIATLSAGVNNDSGAFYGTIQNTGGNLTLVKNGTGTLTLAGTNAYSGGTILNAGTLSPKNNSAFGAGNLTVNGGTVFNAFNPGLSLTVTNPVILNGGTLRTGGGQATTKTTWAGPVTLTSNSTVQSDGTTLGNNFTGGVDLGNGGYTLTVGGNGNNSGSANNFNSVISGGPNATMLGNSAGLIYLNAPNTYSGTFRSGYSLVLQNALAMQNATLDMNTADNGGVMLINNAVLGALTGSRNLNMGGYSIVVGNNNASTTYSGALTNNGSLKKVGSGTLTLSGANTYTGSTTVSAGTLALAANGAVASLNLIVAGGAALDVSGLTSTFVLGGRTLANSSVGAVLSGNNDCSAGTLALLSDGINAAFVQTNGTMALSVGTTVTVNNTGSVFPAGHYTIIAAATAGHPGQVTGTLPPVMVTGNGATGNVSLQINGTGGLDLVVAGTIASNPTNISYTLSGGALTLTWPGDHLGWIAQSNSVSLANTNFWYDIPGSQSGTNLIVPTSSTSGNVFYRLRYPN